MNDYLPSDYDKPLWEVYERVHCWRNHVTEDIQDLWPTFSNQQKIALDICFQDMASAEEWE